MTSTSDPRPAFTAATRATLDVVLDLPVDALHRPTPCAELDVSDLRGHLLTVFRRVAHVGRGGAPFDVPQVPAPVDDLDDALRVAADDALAVWADPALLTRELQHPAGTLPGAALLATYVGELVTHAWDVGVAVGRPVVVADDVVAVGSAASHQLLPPGERPPGFPFGPEVDAPADATPLEALVAWQGRDPRWTA
ncbi:TIGR03086 family protein [Klenkia soli]|uniref:TIGR03086 family protein n=1 Tax=Klenkia soli TaxID=1052260 RepID=A0A1H0SW99_9ACTN|nr:TIGR03086 family metal-binding protein [Klenkia soli]SDP45944.1 TIGR03086 family protein [Klenkia soli]